MFSYDGGVAVRITIFEVCEPGDVTGLRGMNPLLSCRTLKFMTYLNSLRVFGKIPTRGN